MAGRGTKFTFEAFPAALTDSGEALVAGSHTIKSVTLNTPTVSLEPVIVAKTEIKVGFHNGAYYRKARDVNAIVGRVCVVFGIDNAKDASEAFAVFLDKSDGKVYERGCFDVPEVPEWIQRNTWKNFGDYLINRHGVVVTDEGDLYIPCGSPVVALRTSHRGIHIEVEASEGMDRVAPYSIFPLINLCSTHKMLDAYAKLHAKYSSPNTNIRSDVVCELTIYGEQLTAIDTLASQFDLSEWCEVEYMSAPKYNRAEHPLADLYIARFKAEEGELNVYGLLQSLANDLEGSDKDSATFKYPAVRAAEIRELLKAVELLAPRGSVKALAGMLTPKQA